MTKTAVTLFILAIVLAGASLPGPFGAVASEGAGTPPAPTLREAPDVVEIDAVTSATTRYLPVRFNHKAHGKTHSIACETCHTDKPSGDLKDYYHGLCLECHTGKGGPPDCFACHVERK